MELIENNGEVLLTDLNIPEARFRRKLVKFITMKLLGVGSKPPTVEGSQIVGEVGCDNVGIKWHDIDHGSSVMKVVFPVHLYRVQRRVKKSNFMKANKGKESDADKEKRKGSDISGFSNVSNVSKAVVAPFSPSTKPRKGMGAKQSSENGSPYKTVYAGSEAEFVDEDLLPASTYMYRLQAWNAVGHSQWSYLEVSTPPPTGDCAYLQDFMPGTKIIGGEEDNARCVA